MDRFASEEGFPPAEVDSLRHRIRQAFTADAKAVIVKEVTPLLVTSFIEEVRPEIVYLHRHPVAVAASHIALGWGPRRELLQRPGIAGPVRSRMWEYWDRAASDLGRLVVYFRRRRDDNRSEAEEVRTLSAGDI